MCVNVIDPYNVITDEAMPTLGLALDPTVVKRQFRRHLSRVTEHVRMIRLLEIRVVRYKPKRRCVIEYDINYPQPDGQVSAVTLIGKIRNGRFGKNGYRLLEQIWEKGFQATNPDGISVPEPIAMIPKLQLWLQRKVAGKEATELLNTNKALNLARRIAEASYKLHSSTVRIEKNHTMDDELQILDQCMNKLCQTHPDLRDRVELLMTKAHQLGKSLSGNRTCGIHRDFYSDQLIVSDERLWLLDFDLYCNGDPGLDIGNFIGHITEYSLRTFGDADALLDIETALEEHFIALSGEQIRHSVRIYTLLTLIRHIYLSSLFTERQNFTLQILALCERRFNDQIRTLQNAS